MKVYVVVAVVLIAAGILGLVYGQFSYTEESEAARLGPIELTVKEKQTVNIPSWAGAGSIVAGIVLLVIGLKKA